jgi:hypothetical protein
VKLDPGSWLYPLYPLYTLAFLASLLTTSLRAAYFCCRHRQFVFSLPLRFYFRFAASFTSLPLSLPPYFYCRHILTAAAKMPTPSSNEFIQYLETSLGGSLSQINPGGLIHACQQTRTWCDRLERIAKARANPTSVQPPQPQPQLHAPLQPQPRRQCHSDDMKRSRSPTFTRAPAGTSAIGLPVD